MASPSKSTISSPFVRKAPLLNPHDPTGTYERVKELHEFSPAASARASSPKPPGTVRLVCISDTHGALPELPLGDIVLHCGDFSSSGTARETRKFIDWFSALPFKHKVFIAGNHDITLDAELYRESWDSYHRAKEDDAAIRDYIRRADVIYLEDSSVELMGLHIYGSPRTPAFGTAGFQYPMSASAAVWATLPSLPDVLMTHGPPMGHGDLTKSFKRAGDVNLWREVTERVVPTLHVFGHIHDGYGVSTNGRTIFANAAHRNKGTKGNAPLVFDVKPRVRTDAIDGVTSRASASTVRADGGVSGADV